jgi:hypothetical protein
MGLKRLPSEQSLDELLKTLEDSEEKNIVGVTTDDVFSFISTFNILPGNEPVLKNSLYNLYRNWSNEPLSRNSFGVRMSKHFLSHQIGPKQYYKLNTTSLAIEKETLNYIEKQKVDRTKSPSWQKHFKDYLEFYKIEKGKTWVQSFVLFHFYDKWCYKNKRKCMLSEITFFNFCKLYFEYKRNTESRMMWFGVNKEFVEHFLSPQKLTHLQQAREKKYGKRQKSKNKIPSIKTRAKSKIKV